MPKKDVFERAPEFLAAFNNVAKNGFFEAIQVNIEGIEGNVLSCCINARGFLPNCVKYKAKGCSALVNPSAVITACRWDIKGRKVKSVSVKVETDNWPHYDRKGDNVIGSRGERVTLFFMVVFR